MHKEGRHGFTLIEIVVVLMIVAILAAVTYPKFQDKVADAEQTAFAESLRLFVDAAFIFKADTGSYPMNSDTGTLGSDGFANYIDETKFLAETPIGGLWDVHLGSASRRAGIGVHFLNSPVKSIAYMTEIDTMLDDGDISAGKFRRVTRDRYYFVLSE